MDQRNTIAAQSDSFQKVSIAGFSVDKNRNRSLAVKWSPLIARVL